MKMKLTALGTTILLGLGSVFAIPSVKADTNQNSSQIQAGISKANTEISQYQSQLDQLNQQVARVDQAISDNNKMVTDTEKKITDTQAQVGQLQNQVGVIKDRIAKRTEVLKERARSYQDNGTSQSYLDVLLGSSSFSDFIERVGAVATIVQADQEIMKQQEADKQEVENKEALVQKKLDNLKNMKTDLLGMQQQILEQKAQNDALKGDLQKEKQNSVAEKASLQQQANSLAAKALQEANGNSNSNTGSINFSAPSVSGSGAAQKVITAGYKYIGNSVYVFGGGRNAYDVANGRFDCSGFVHWAFAQAGYHIGSNTDSLINEGTRVSVSDMRPGDLVFFDTYKPDGHVGIYMGGGKFIGSQSSTGVAIANLSSGYWRAHFNGHVVRIIN